MKKIKVGDLIKFNSIKDVSVIEINKEYKVLKTENYKRNEKTINYVTIIDEYKNEYRIKVEENFEIIYNTNDLKKKSVFQKEIELLENVLNCFQYKNDYEEKVIHKNLKLFCNINDTSKSDKFKYLLYEINSSKRNEPIIIVKIMELIDIIEEKAYYFGEKIGKYEHSKIYKIDIDDEVDSFDEEKDIMNSFRNGEQDKYGY